MPNLDTSLEEQIRLRLLLYGPAKTKKTWLAGTAAEAGFNVLLLDNEQGAGILRNLSAEARRRIYRIDIQDDGKRAIAAEFITYFCKFPKFYWDETAKKRMGRPDENCIQIDRSRFGKNTVVILDSYSGLIWSIAYRYCLENNIDLSDAEKTEWEGYRWAGQLATWMLQQLTQLPCHFILVGHQEMYEKRRDNKVEWSRLQMKSVSGPHGMTIAKAFDDILYFSVQGSSFYIDTRPDKDRDSGGRIVPPARYKWEELQVKDICKMAGIDMPPTDLFPVSQLVAVDKDNIVEPDAASSIKSAARSTTLNSGGVKTASNLLGKKLGKTLGKK